MDGDLVQKSIVIPLYDVEVIVYFSKGMAEVVQDLEVIYDITGVGKNGGAKALKITNGNGQNKFILIYAVGKLQHWDVNDIIAHEALHMSWMLCDYLGIKIDAMNHEPQAYILENIVKQVTKIKDEYFKV